MLGLVFSCMARARSPMATSLPELGVDGDDRRLVHHHAAVVDDQGIGRTEVDGQLLCQRKKSHMFFLFIISILSGFRAGTAGVWGSHLQR